jgi:hypothetical protein
MGPAPDTNSSRTALGQILVVDEEVELDRIGVSFVCAENTLSCRNPLIRRRCRVRLEQVLDPQVQ